MPITILRPLKSLYIHIPFCKSKCYYCSFVSLTDKNNYIDAYVNALLKEMNSVLSSYKKQRISSVYIGGGTPSLLEVKHFEQILTVIYDLLDISMNTEITVEVNPGTVDRKYLNELYFSGISRVSIGVQSFDDQILKTINRIHNKQQAIETVKIAEDAGFNNISIDLIYGLPGQDLKLWEETLNQAVELDIRHISTYGLKIEEGTVFGRTPPPNLPDQDIAADMYLKTIEILEKNNFKHYEISNFAKSGCESKHNLAYWNNEEYFGFGLAAHGYLDGVRYSNSCDFNEYLDNPLKRASEHKMTEKEILEEAVFLGLRRVKGINMKKFNSEYGVDLVKMYKDVIKKYTDYGFMEIKKDYLRLTTKGILISNSILAEFLL